MLFCSLQHFCGGLVQMNLYRRIQLGGKSRYFNKVAFTNGIGGVGSKDHSHQSAVFEVVPQG